MSKLRNKILKFSLENVIAFCAVIYSKVIEYLNLFNKPGLQDLRFINELININSKVYTHLHKKIDRSFVTYC